MNWFTSDWHLNHKNILQYDRRPFDTVEEMNETIIDNINKVVKKEDTLYYLGDFCFALNGKLDAVYEFRDRILCDDIRFILGNHDHIICKNKHLLIAEKWFTSIDDVYYVNNTKPSVYLSHYAHKVWDKSHHGRYHLYGHSHCTLPDDPASLSFDVGINGNNYYPYSFDDVKRIMSKKNYAPVDHHHKGTT
jgi:calcineurin-like phosphoesterase family protein